MFTYIHIDTIHSIAFVSCTHTGHSILKLAFVNQHCISGLSMLIHKEVLFLSFIYMFHLKTYTAFNLFFFFLKDVYIFFSCFAIANDATANTLLQVLGTYPLRKDWQGGTCHSSRCMGCSCQQKDIFHLVPVSYSLSNRSL